MIKNNKNKKGFSIGEVMVAMFILTFGIVSAVFLTAQSAGQIGESRNAIIASLLAQEGTELVKNVRDNNVTQTICGSNGDDRCTAFDDDTGYGWANHSSPMEYECIIDYGGVTTPDKILDCNPAPGAEQLYINETTYLYSHVSGGNTVSPFSRKVYIKYIDSSEIDEVAMDVASVVIWKKGSFPTDIDDIETKCKISQNCVFAKTRLTSWINYGE